MIELKNITKIYGKGEGSVIALNDISITIPEGQFTSIIGKSGSGKSTMMNLIGALDIPTSGDIIIDGVSLSKKKPDELAEFRNQKIGYIFQSFYLEPTFTVLENVAMPLTIAGLPKKVREAKAMDAIKLLDLEDKALKKANELSGGQKQRVSIARAIVHSPSYILADEPTGNLDSHNGAEVIRLLKNIAKSGKTVLLITHNPDDAKKAEFVIQLKDGSVENYDKADVNLTDETQNLYNNTHNGIVDITVNFKKENLTQDSPNKTDKSIKPKSTADETLENIYDKYLYSSPKKGN